MVADVPKVELFRAVANAQGRVAGEVALRIGDSPEQFYLGHIGYHIDPPFRGHGYAARACRLAAPVFGALGYRFAVITTDPDNQPSVKTCLRLCCELESTVRVPPWVKEKLDISDVKHRFLWTVPNG
jgi:predicted acetyltransferase